VGADVLIQNGRFQSNVRLWTGELSIGRDHQLALPGLVRGCKNSVGLNSENDTNADGAQSKLPQPIPAPEDFAQLLKKHRSFAQALRAYVEPYYARIPRFACGPTPEADRARFERVFRPWPKWVFRLAAEVWHVRCPTISKDTFSESFRVINAIMFRCSVDRVRSWSVVSSTIDRIDLHAMHVVLASFIGHSVEHFESARKKLNALRQAGQLSEKDYAEQLETLSRCSIEPAIREMFATWSKEPGANPLDLTRALENARRQTFDRDGNLKETPLTPVYEVMLSNWIRVENMTGPKELLNFLSPEFKGSMEDAEREVGRIATLCSRLGVRFRGRVKQS
jgi:hypothetical protein